MKDVDRKPLHTVPCQIQDAEERLRNIVFKCSFELDMPELKGAKLQLLIVILPEYPKCQEIYCKLILSDLWYLFVGGSKMCWVNQIWFEIDLCWSIRSVKKFSASDGLFFSFSAVVKRVCEIDLGIITQCCRSERVFKHDDTYFDHFALKIDIKVFLSFYLKLFLYFFFL